MALSVNFSTLIIDSDASITDIVAFHLALRDIEDGADAAIHPVIHTYKRVDLGGGAYFHAVDFVNGWTLRFPAPGSYSIIGNINATIVPVAGVFVERTKAAAFATTSVGGSGPTAADIAAAVGSRTVEGTMSQDAMTRVILAALAGRTEGIGTLTEKYKSADGAKDRITVSFDASSNRTTIVLDGS